MAKASEKKVESTKQEEKEQKGGGIVRRGIHFPSLFSLRPREFFTMSPFEMMKRFNHRGHREHRGSYIMRYISGAIECKRFPQLCTSAISASSVVNIIATY